MRALFEARVVGKDRPAIAARLQQGLDEPAGWILAWVILIDMEGLGLVYG